MKMGEIADMMVNGFMCQSCGQFMPDGEEPGYPRDCQDCKNEDRRSRRKTRRNKKRKGER